MQKIIFLFFWLCAVSGISSPSIAYWNESYFLPQDHPLQEKLMSIFCNKDVLKNEESFKKAGFVTLYKQKTQMRVASHPLLSGYLIKAYLNDLSPNQGSQWLFDRCKGAENVRNLIDREKLRYFVVPQKAIYLLPGLSFSTKKKQVAVLIVEDMDLVTKEETKKAWKKAGPEQIQELYCILSHGFASCAISGNIPYTKKGVFACVDTAYPERVFTYPRIKGYFSESMQIYWDQLQQNR